MGHQSGLWEPFSLAAIEHLFDQSEHGILVEMAFSQIGILPWNDFELAPLLGGGRVDAGPLKAQEMFVTQPGVDDVKGFFTLLEAIPDEGEQNLVFLVCAMKESTHMPVPVKSCAG